MPFKNVGVVGTTGLAASLIRPLCDHPFNFNVTVFTRPATGAATVAAKRAALPPPAKLVELRDDGLVAAFSGIDALVCPISGFAVEAQLKYIEAAEAAGVKRFIPSEFGMDNDVHPTAMLNAPKVPIRDRLRNSPSLEFTFVYTGLWIDHFLVGPANPYGFDWQNATAHAVPADGDVPVSTIHSRDVAAFVAEMLADEDSSKSRNTKVLLESEKVTWNQIIAYAEEIIGRRFAVSNATVHELVANAGPAGTARWFFAHLKVLVASGQVILAYRDNAKWPAVKPITVRDYLKRDIYSSPALL
ncbi:hypothetical protein HK405_004085 [Cladochytrium tenue]|nr:hypothetical protein HK405_004085 [Cladochytrium tenue]